MKVYGNLIVLEGILQYVEEYLEEKGCTIEFENLASPEDLDRFSVFPGISGSDPDQVPRMWILIYSWDAPYQHMIELVENLIDAQMDLF